MAENVIVRDAVNPNYILKVAADGSIAVTGGGGGGGGAITAPIGQTTDNNSVAVTLSTDQTDVVSGTESVKVVIINPADGTYLSYSTPTNVVGPTANGAAAANPPILVGGTANGTATGNVGNWKVDSSGLGYVAIAAGSAVIGHVITDSGSVSVASGTTASGSSIAANPVTIGGRAATSTPSAVADGQVVNWQMTKTGRGVVVGALRTNLGIQETTITSSTAETTVVTAVASTFNDIYGLTVTNSSATATKVTLKDSTAGTTRWVGYIPAGDMRGFMLPVDSAIPQATVNTNWTITCGTSVASIDVSVFFVANI